MAFFTTFGTFSIAAGILLIFLIFVMLAAERRGELGIARAVGTRRGTPRRDVHVRGSRLRPRSPPLVGALLGALVALGMVTVMASAFAAADEDEGLQIEFAVTLRSLVIAFALGMLLTLVVVAVSAWRVSVMNISIGDPQPARAADDAPGDVASCWPPSRSSSADCSMVSGTSSGTATPGHARRLARSPRPHPACCRSWACRSGSRTRRAGAQSS